MHSLKYIILLGPPASGKGTQGSRISEFLNLPILGTGNILRKAVEEGTTLGVEAKSFLDGGMYVPDSLIESLVVEWVDKNQQGWIFDGFPRTLPQAKFIEQKKQINEPDLVIGLDVSKSELERRINSRRQCRKCGAVTSTFLHEGKICPVEGCEGELYARNDDAIDSFRVRFSQFEELTQPLFDYYEAKGILAKVDGEQTPQQVTNEVLKILHQYSVKRKIS